LIVTLTSTYVTYVSEMHSRRSHTNAFPVYWQPWCTGVLRVWAKGAKFPWRRITAEGAEKSQQCHENFLE